MYETMLSQGAPPFIGRYSWQTGTHKNGKIWPRDFLPKTLPNARIVSFGYNAEFASFYTEDRRKIAPELTIDDYSTSLLDSLRALRKGEEAVSKHMESELDCH